jgi:hypothetical protein
MARAPHMDALSQKFLLLIANLDKPESNKFEDKKIDHESTKIRRHESLNVVLFRVFNLSCFRDCVSEFSARKNAKIIIKVLKSGV